jgi:hypothetical protein
MERLIFLQSKNGVVGMTRHNGITTENSIMRNITLFRHFLASYCANNMLHTYDITYGDVVPETAEGLENCGMFADCLDKHIMDPLRRDSPSNQLLNTA